MIAFVDGSFNAKTRRYGFGCVYLFPDGRCETEYGSGEDPLFLSARNVAGELEGTMAAMRRAISCGFSTVRICHDYSGIAFWYLGEWKANTPVAKNYVGFCQTVKERLAVSFEKIAAHTGVTYNECADRLAKCAVGLAEDGNNE